MQVGLLELISVGRGRRGSVGIKQCVIPKFVLYIYFYLQPLTFTKNMIVELFLSILLFVKKFPF